MQLAGFAQISCFSAHPATLWGGLFLILSQPARLLITGTSVWFAFAAWLKG
jgi:hypothetical protein